MKMLGDKRGIQLTKALDSSDGLGSMVGNAISEVEAFVTKALGRIYGGAPAGLQDYLTVAFGKKLSGYDPQRRFAQGDLPTIRARLLASQHSLR